MKFQKATASGWVDKKTLRTGDIAKIVTEAQEEEGQNGMQVVAKLRIKGDTNEPKKVAFNPQTRNALIDAFGDDSKDWMDRVLTVHIEKTLIGGKRGIAVYLLPTGYVVSEDAGGYLVILPENEAQKTKQVANNPDQDIDDAFENAFPN